MRIKIVVLSRGRSAPALHPFFFCCTCVYSASVSPHSQSIDTERALARVRSSASQTCLWFFSIREIIKGVISIPNSCILRARSSCVIGGFCNARPSRTDYSCSNSALFSCGQPVQSAFLLCSFNCNKCTYSKTACRPFALRPITSRSRFPQLY